MPHLLRRKIARASLGLSAALPLAARAHVSLAARCAGSWVSVRRSLGYFRTGVPGLDGHATQRIHRALFGLAHGYGGHAPHL